jgi:hypothetical protein
MEGERAMSKNDTEKFFLTRNRCIAMAATLFFSMAGALCAQGIKFSGYFNSGLGAVSTDQKNSDTFVRAFGVDSEQHGYRLRLNGSFTGEAENTGVKIRLQSQSQLNQAGYFSIPYMYGWMTFWDGVFYTAGGIVDDTDWETADWWFDDDAGEGLGLLLKAVPVAGLNLGLGAYVISQQAKGNNNILSLRGSAPLSLADFKDVTPKIGDVKYVFSASYTMPDIFWLGASFRTKNKAGWDRPIDNETLLYVYNGRQESAQFIGELRFWGIEHLNNAAVVAILDKLEDFEANGDIVYSETFDYKIGGVTVGLNAVQFLYNRKYPSGQENPHDPGLLFNVWGEYAVSVAIAPRLDIVYFIGGMSEQGYILSGGLNQSSATMYHRRGIKNAPNETRLNYTRYLFSVRPSVKFNIDPKTFIEVGDLINIDYSNRYVYASEMEGLIDSKSRVTNVAYVDLKWEF